MRTFCIAVFRRIRHRALRRVAEVGWAYSLRFDRCAPEAPFRRPAKPRDRIRQCESCEWGGCRRNSAELV